MPWGSWLCGRELWAAECGTGAVWSPWSQAGLGEKHWWRVHLLQVLAPLECVWQSYKSSVKSKSTSYLRGRVNSCGGTAGRAPFGEGECDQRVSICSCFIWIHLAPSLVSVMNIVNNCLSPLLPPIFSAVVSSGSESDSEFSSSSLDDKPLPVGSKGSQGRKHRAGLGEELLFLVAGGWEALSAWNVWLLILWVLAQPLACPMWVQPTGFSCAR